MPRPVINNLGAESANLHFCLSSKQRLPADSEDLKENESITAFIFIIEVAYPFQSRLCPHKRQLNKKRPENITLPFRSARALFSE
jgi:hypothetical protein